MALTAIRRLLSASFALAVCAFTAQAAYASQSAQTPVLDQLEQRFFFQTYSADDANKRLARIEKRVFGSAMPGDTAERMSRLSGLATPQVNPDGLTIKPARQPAPVLQEEPAAPVAATAPAPVTQAPAVQPARQVTDAQEEQQLAIERARVSVQAAKEEEIRDLLAQGVQLWRAKRAQEALEKFEQVIRLDPQNADAHFSMGIIEEISGNFVEAQSSYRLAAKYRPNNKDFKDALAAVEKKLQAKQKVVGDQSDLRQLAEDAVAAYRRGEIVSALDLYKALDQKQPNQHTTKYNIGTVYVAMKIPDRALDYYKQALKLNPQEPRYIQVVQQIETVMARRKEQENQYKREYNQAKSASGSGTAKADAAPQGQNLLSNYGLVGKTGSAGVVVTTVGIASKASQTGIQRGDVIIAVDGNVVKNPREINEIIERKGAGAPLQLMIQRDKQVAQVTL